MSYEECEMLILKNAVENIEEKEGRKVVMSPEVKEIISIVEKFLRDKKLICYGGTAINNILPLEDQFYNKDIEIPDYDFFSDNALSHAKELADIYYKKGFTDVEAKAGVHHGTYKVFVNFIPVADITYLVPELFKSLSKESIVVEGIHYAPPNYLRMAMYLELSRPLGDVSRWEKVLKRLTLLNKNYPLVGEDCDINEIQREFDSEISEDKQDLLFHTLRDSLINQKVVFFGSMANRLYMKYLNKKNKLRNIPDFDVLSEYPKQTADKVKQDLREAGIKYVKIKKQNAIGEIIAPHYEVMVGDETLAFIYEPLACHSFNVIKIKNKSVRIATIDTMLSFYLAFLYADRPYYDENRILCMAEYLFKVQQKNRLAQKGLLRRFNINCYGKQLQLSDMRLEKAKKFNELKNKRNTKEYEEWFLRYIPNEKFKTKKNKKQVKKTIKKNTNKKKRKTRKNGIIKKIKNLF